MTEPRIEKVLQWMREIEIGEGDITTECVSPYARHSRGKLIVKESGLFSGREVIDILFEPAVEQLNVDWNVEEGSEIKAGDEIFSFEGSGAEILKVYRLVEWIIGRMSGIATSARYVVEALEKSGKRLIAGSTVSPIFEAFDEIAFTTAGGVFERHGLSDSIYVTKNHLSYAGGISDIIERIVKELGEARKTVKIEVEVNSFDEFITANDQDCEVIHLVGLDEIQIRDVFEKSKPRKKPILHINSMDEWREEYREYYFRFCAVESLHTDIHYITNKLIFGSIESENN